MALTTAYITLNWSSNYPGQHRVCYRIQGSGSPYTCTTSLTPHPNCPGGALPCSYQISIMVDNETCDVITYEGYVQPICEDETSLANRTTFVVSFIPSPACKRWELLCASGSVQGATVTNPGSGYNPLSAPTVTITGGGGSGATATAIVGQGIIGSTSITTGGVGYTNGSYTNVPLIGGTGTGGTVDVTVTGGVITAVTLNTAGTGYQNATNLAPDPSVVGTPGTPGEIAIVTNYGIITGITMGTTGSGYTSTPTVTIAAPVSGVTALATAVLTICAGQLGRECPDVITEYRYPSLSVGESIALCSETAPTPPTPYTVTQVGSCLCNCESATIAAVGGDITVTYYNCTTSELTTTTVLEDSDITVCAVVGSLVVVETSGTADITPLGNCTGE